MFTGKEMSRMINDASVAHQDQSRKPSKAFRIWDKETPYVVHSIWGAMSVLHETQLSENTRVNCAKALVFHDVLEDTTAFLPEYLEDEVVDLIKEVTFQSQEEAMEKIWQSSDEAQLVTLYDMVSNMMDGSWMDEKQKVFYLDYTLKLKDAVQSKLGDLNIVKIAESLSSPPEPHR